MDSPGGHGEQTKVGASIGMSRVGGNGTGRVRRLNMVQKSLSARSNGDECWEGGDDPLQWIKPWPRRVANGLALGTLWPDERTYTGPDKKHVFDGWTA